MARLPILTAPDKRLKQQALPVPRVDDAIRQLMDDMLDTMYAAPGIGLAAPQVGVSQRIIILDISYGKEEGGKRSPIFLANPQIVEAVGEVEWEEGCLSVPDQYAKVSRAAQVTLTALDRENREITLSGEGLLAVCLQHEVDHLNGTLFIDRISRLKRELILKKMRKLLEEKPPHPHRSPLHTDHLDL